MRLLTLIAALALIPHAASAEEDLVGIALFEMECREEMNLVGVILPPGKVKGDFRGCIRLKTSNARTVTETKRSRTSSGIEEKEILDQVLERQRQIFGDPARSTKTLRDKYNMQCREKLGIGANEIVKAGPKLGTLRRCIGRMTSETNRASNLRRRRSSVQQRSTIEGGKLKQRKEADLQEELDRRSTNQRTRLQTQTKANPRLLKQIRESYRVRSFFTNDPVETRARQKQNAQACRKVPAKEWGTCIREALGN
jgi:hypothetical protein